MQRQLNQIVLPLKEFAKTEADLTNKAKEATDKFLKIDLASQSLTSEEMLIFSNAIAHFICLSEDTNPFHEIKADNLDNTQRALAIIKDVDARMGDPENNQSFKLRAISMLWLTLNYEDLNNLFIKMKISTLENSNYLISPMQRLLKFPLFAKSLHDALDNLIQHPEMISDQALLNETKKSLTRLSLRASGIATLTNEITKSIDPRTIRPLIKSCSDDFVVNTISNLVKVVLEMEPNEDKYKEYLITVRGNIQKELAQRTNPSSIGKKLSGTIDKNEKHSPPESTLKK